MVKLWCKWLQMICWLSLENNLNWFADCTLLDRPCLGEVANAQQNNNLNRSMVSLRKSRAEGSPEGRVGPDGGRPLGERGGGAGSLGDSLTEGSRETEASFGGLPAGGGVVCEGGRQDPNGEGFRSQKIADSEGMSQWEAGDREMGCREGSRGGREGSDRSGEQGRPSVWGRRWRRGPDRTNTGPRGVNGTQRGGVVSENRERELGGGGHRPGTVAILTNRRATVPVPIPPSLSTHPHATAPLPSPHPLPLGDGGELRELQLHGVRDEHLRWGLPGRTRRGGTPGGEWGLGAAGVRGFGGARGASHHPGTLSTLTSGRGRPSPCPAGRAGGGPGSGWTPWG